MARRVISVKYAKNLTPEERRVLHGMTFKKRGALSDWLNDAVDWKTDDKVILCKEEGQVVGWGMRIEKNKGSWYPAGSVGFWTRSTHRRQGIGGRMVLKAMTLGPIVTHPHDVKSQGLFQKYGQTGSRKTV